MRPTTSARASGSTLRGGVPLGGIVYNGRSQIDEPAIVEDFAGRIGKRVVGRVPMSPVLSKAEIRHKTVIEHSPGSEIAAVLRRLAADIADNEERVTPQPLSDGEMDEIYGLIDEMIDEG